MTKRFSDKDPQRNRKEIDSQSISIRMLAEEYEMILNSIHDEIMVVDPAGEIIFVNKACERFYSLKFSELIGRRVKDLEKNGVFSPSVSDVVLKTRNRQSFMQTTRTGKEILVTAIPIVNNANELTMVVCNSRDMSELSKLRSELEEKEKLLEVYSREIKKLTANSVDESFVYVSKKMEDIYNIIVKVASSDISILLLGESGVGKTMIAHVIHNLSERKKGPILVINCSAIPETLLESELFGYEKGSFTGAVQQGKKGLFELARGGTIFLDEIGDISQSLQVKLLQVIQDKKFRRIGGVDEISADSRIITATNQNLGNKIQNKQFREDLYYRINGISITVPALRERTEDIAYLAHLFLEQCSAKYNLKKRISNEVMEVFYRYPWPGNIRELKNLIERIYLLSEEEKILICDLPGEMHSYIDGIKAFPDSFSGNLTLKKSIEKLEHELVLTAYAKHKNSYKVADALGISQPSAYRKIQKYISQFRSELK